jgi:hypothetical protein
MLSGFAVIFLIAIARQLLHIDTTKPMPCCMKEKYDDL